MDASGGRGRATEATRKWPCPATHLAHFRARAPVLLLAVYWLAEFSNQAAQCAANYATNQNQKLEAPPAVRQPIFHGPGIDLVAVNRRRFELEHNHPSGLLSEEQLAQGELIESKVAAIPDRILSQLPEELNKQIAESLSTDSSLLIGTTSVGAQATHLAAMSLEAGDTTDDPDGASIERLTKSCLTVHASSNRPEQLNVTFQLYTKNNPIAPHIIWPHTSRLELVKSSPFDPSKPVKWITHGFHTNVDKSEWMLETKDKILAFEDANVILTDWRRGASPALAFYPKAAANAHVVAKIIVKLLRRLRNDIDLSRVHLIGHSLGAHIMGFVGSAFTEEHLHGQQQVLSALVGAEQGQGLRASASGQRQALSWGGPHQKTAEQLIDVRQLIGRITACDPALPCFGPTSSAPSNKLPGSNQKQHQQHQHQLQVAALQQDLEASGRLQQDASAAAAAVAAADDWTPSMWTHLRPDSALVVEVMHSNPGVMGYSEPLGDFDLYPNGLERQPGCGQLVASPDLSNVLRSGDQAERMSQPLAGRTQPRQLMGNPFSFMGIRNLFGHRSSGLQQSSGHGDAIRSSQEAGSPAMVVSAMDSQVDNSPLRLSNTLDRLIKPIRDFFHGYTCSHHRSVEYMVESMYYEEIPQDRRLDKDLVCQMVGYRCRDYLSFKKGFCFRCQTELDCRSFTLGVVTPPRGSHNRAQLQTGSGGLAQDWTRGEARNFRGPFHSESVDMGRIKRNQVVVSSQALDKFTSRLLAETSALWPSNQGDTIDSSATVDEQNNDNNRTISSLVETTNFTNSKISSPKPSISQAIHKATDRLNSTKNYVIKRMLPTFNHRDLEYRPKERNLYYFDTRPAKSFCLHHYHLYVKYRWFRVRQSVAVEGLKIVGTLANITELSPITFNMFTFQTYTMLLTEAVFLGQVESLIMLGGQLKPTVIEYIDVTYMSNLDSRIRALGSARLCRQPDNHNRNRNRTYPASAAHDPFDSQDAITFIRCSGTMV